MTTDLLKTVKQPALTMAELVYGKPRPAKRFRLPTRLIFVAALAGMMVGCATAQPKVVEVETVGQLSASYHSVAVAPVHATTDLSGGFQAVDSGDDIGAAVTTVSRVEDAGELPAVAAKTDGVTIGEAR